MRKLALLLLVVPLVFTAYWVAVSRGVEAGLRGWFAARTAEGWAADFDTLGTRGFPRRFETVLTDIVLADPATGVAWSAPRFTLAAGAFQPNRIAALLPGEQRLASPYGGVEILSERFLARLGLVPGPQLEIDTLEADLRAVRLVASAGWEAGLGTGRVIAAAADAPATYDLDVTLTDFVPTAAQRATLDPAGLLPGMVEGLTLTARLVFDAPWDRRALEEARPQITAIDLRDLRAQWGRLELRAAGELVVGADGLPEGRITVKAVNWREILDLARNAGLASGPFLPALERMLETLAGLSGPPDTLDAPLTFARGFVSFGPLPLGPAPRLTIR